MLEIDSAAKEVLGHQWAVDFVGRSCQAGRGVHAYLLVGPPHVGKFATALVLARSLLCGQFPACGVCRHCILAGRRIHPDLRVLEIPPEHKTIPLRDVHEFTEGIALRPLEAARKVYILRDADGLSDEGANALLKTIEEPPPAVVILLTAPSVASLPATIVSRCQVIALHSVPSERIEAHLMGVLGVPPDQAAAIARASRGRPGWAIRAARDRALLDERRHRATDLLRLVGASRLDRIAYADEMAEKWSSGAEEVRDVLEEWADIWRGIMLRQEGVAPAFSDGEPADVDAAARTLSDTAVRDALAMTLDTASALDRNANGRLALEAYTLLLPRPRAQHMIERPEV